MREVEEELTSVIERVLERDFGIVLGARQRRDARDASKLRVDFTYDPVGHAVEITTTPDPSVAGVSEAVKLAGRLSQVKSGWLVVVKDHARIRDLDEHLVALMKRGASFRPGEYTSEDIERWLAERRLVEETAWRDRLERIGVVAIEPRPGNEGVEAMVMGDMATFEGITDELASAVADNASKLAECRPRVTHLVVGISRFGVSREPTVTVVPELPDAIDHLWVINRWRPPVGASQLWRTDRGDRVWSLHDEPEPVTST